MTEDELDQAFSLVERQVRLKDKIQEVKKEGGPQIGTLHHFLKVFRSCPSCEFHDAPKLSELHSYQARTWTELYQNSGIRSSSELSEMLAKAENAKWIERTKEGHYQLTEDGKYADVQAQSLTHINDPPPTAEETEELIKKFRSAEERYNRLKEKQGF